MHNTEMGLHSLSMKFLIWSLVLSQGSLTLGGEDVMMENKDRAQLTTCPEVSNVCVCPRCEASLL